MHLKLVWIVFVSLLISGCATRSSPYAADQHIARNTAESERLNQQAADLMAVDHSRAEPLLRKALSHDLYNGPAHNNLGVIYLTRGQLYEAATEFEWARKLMPGHPDPRLNLALTLEQAGHVAESLETFDAALEVYPGHLPSIMGLTRAQIRSGMTDDRTREFLSIIALRGNEEWRSWAKNQLLKER